MKEFEKFNQTVAQLKAAIDKVSAAKTSAEVNAADSEIGACLRSIQYGTGMVGIECKHLVENKNRELRGNNFTAPVVEIPVVEEKPAKKTKKRRSKKAE